ncbi:MAG TPA: amidohydrolase/deacetylase family metallohydrolase [Candidatus Solibacter sp.]|nr:amidohydrolase/deacetylase family metallohydrolase [Candidatus Solibacter sp.]
MSPAVYSLVLRNGHVIDPSQGVNRVTDVALQDGRVAAVGDSLGPGLVEKDVRGKYVCPGLIDLHGHWWEGSSWGIDPDICLNHGVTTAIDAGTTGFINFPAFRKTQVSAATIRVLAFVNISGVGIPTTLVGELEDIRFARPRETGQVIESNRDICLGVKIREGAMTGSYGAEALGKAIEAAQSVRLPMMVHITKGADTPYILRQLRPGDIVTHCFQGRGDGILSPDDARLLPEVSEARKLGVLFDVGHGAGGFSWDVARKAFEHFFFPDTISTDLHRYSIARWAFDLPSVMSKFLHLGVPLADVILKTTRAPAMAIGRGDELGTLKPGAAADLFVFELEEGSFPLEDTHVRTESAARRIRPFLTIKDGANVEPCSYPVRLRELYECDHDFFRFIEQTANPR